MGIYEKKVNELASSKQRAKSKAAREKSQAETDISSDKARRSFIEDADTSEAEQRASDFSKKLEDEGDTEAIISDISKRGYMAPKNKKTVRKASASYNPPPSSVREQYMQDAPEEYSRGGKMGRSRGGVVTKKAKGGKVMSRGVALRGFGKEIR